MSRREPVRREERVMPTPETLAKLKPAPWEGLPPDLERAWKGISAAIGMIGGGMAMRAAEMHWVEHATSQPEYAPHQVEILWRYKRWAQEMRAERMNIPYVIGVVSLDEPNKYQGLTLSALKLYAKVNRGRY